MMYPDWVEKYRDENHEVKMKNGNYYLYEYEIINDANGNTIRKLSSRHCGRITEDGLIPRIRRKKSDKIFMVSSHREYGISHLVDVICSDILDNLRIYFPDDAEMLFFIAKQFFMGNMKLEGLAYNYEVSFDGITYLDLDLSLDIVLDLLDRLSINRLARYRFMHSYMNHENYLLFNSFHEHYKFSTHILCCFQQQSFAYFRFHYLDQSLEETIKNAVTEIKAKNVVWFGEHNFDDYTMLNNNHISYIIPIDSHDELSRDYYFIYQNRKVYYQIKTIDEDKLFLFNDEAIIIIEHCKRLPVALRTNMSKEAKEIYELYMDKKIADDAIEIFFDILEINKSYLKEHYEVGLLFIDYISVMMYNRLVEKLKNTDLTTYEIMNMLGKITRQMINNKWITHVPPSVDLDKIKQIIPEFNIKV